MSCQSTSVQRATKRTGISTTQYHQTAEKARTDPKPEPGAGESNRPQTTLGHQAAQRANPKHRHPHTPGARQRHMRYNCEMRGSTKEKLETQMHLYRKAFTKYFLLQSLQKVLSILRTTKLAQSNAQYYFVLQSLHKALPSTTPHATFMQPLQCVLQPRLPNHHVAATRRNTQNASKQPLHCELRRAQRGPAIHTSCLSSPPTAT